jgi:hypothetical protein
MAFSTHNHVTECAIAQTDVWRCKALIWNDPLSSPDLSKGGWLFLSVRASRGLTLIEKTTNGVTQRRTIPVGFVALTRAH